MEDKCCDECGDYVDRMWRVEIYRPGDAKKIRYKCIECVKGFCPSHSSAVNKKPPRILDSDTGGFTYK